MVIWSQRTRIILWCAFWLVFAVVVLAPIAVVVLASVSTTWNSVLPNGITTQHLQDALSADDLASASVSLQTGVIASTCAVVLGTWTALALRSATPGVRRFVDGLFHAPLAVPSVVIGLALLVAFSRPPVLFNGTRWIVLVAHLLIVLPLTYGMVAAAVQRLDPRVSRAAASLGARPARVLLSIELPALAPAMAGSAGLAFALSLGELGATKMLYPPDWRTLPVSIFVSADRGALFAAAASAVVLLVITVMGLVALSVRRRGRTT